MFTAKEIRKASLKNFKNNLSSSIILSIVLGLFVIVLTIPGFFDVGQTALIFIFPLVIVPFFFATQIAHFALREKIELSLKRQMNFFLAYFSTPFRGVYSIIKSLLYSLLAFFVSAIVVSVFSGLITANIYPEFTALQNEIIAFTNAGDVDSINLLLSKNATIFAVYYNFTFIPSLFVALFVFAFLSSCSSLQIYFRIKQPIRDHRLSKFIYTKAKKMISSQLQKMYWVSNFPLFILMLFGFVGGVLLTTIFTIDFNYLVTFGVIGAVFCMMFFLPFYFSNMEEIYLSNQEHFKEIASKTTEELVGTIRDELNSFTQNKKNEDEKDDEVK